MSQTPTLQILVDYFPGSAAGIVKNAAEAVDEALVPPHAHDPLDDPIVPYLLGKGRKITAIKHVRGDGSVRNLKEAKDAVDALDNKLRTQAYTQYPAPPFSGPKCE